MWVSHHIYIGDVHLLVMGHVLALHVLLTGVIPKGLLKICVLCLYMYMFVERLVLWINLKRGLYMRRVLKYASACVGV